MTKFFFVFLISSLLYSNSAFSNEFVKGIQTYQNSALWLLAPRGKVFYEKRTVCSESELDILIEEVSEAFPFILEEAIIEAAVKSKGFEADLHEYRGELFMHLTSEDNMLAEYYKANQSPYVAVVKKRFDEKYSSVYENSYLKSYPLFVSQFIDRQIITALEFQIEACEQLFKSLRYFDDRELTTYNLSKYIFLKTAQRLAEIRLNGKS
ncbi:hypothetical protein QTP81_01375 [Alteromonas sp. ASW11-36]|uniref:Uncharacterized protein n=1 Tax=Alteromonas arenosi TaxID=3055817 RepID=A0ABT7SST0_9ALTE|nr:hypothetical protein [Alteromonas sp. ASW11-36]MDM7859254.1 hypothetical protein [Alteromonas sp. ASW11-36]